MKTTRRARWLVALVAVGAIVVGAVALGGGRDSAPSMGVGGVDMVKPESDDGGFTDAMTSVDAALGRPSSVEPFAVHSEAGKTANAANTAPPVAPLPVDAKTAQRQVAGSSGSSAGPATTAAAPPVPGAPAPDAVGSVDGRKIVQTASLRLQVKEVGPSFEEVGRIATGAGGFVASSNFSLQGEQQVAAVTIRVPATRYQEVLGQLRSVGAKVDGETSNASDVTEEYSDLTARVRNLEATEGQLIALLGRANSISDVLQVQDRLNNVRTQIDQAKGRMVLLDKLSDLATISVSLRPIAVAMKSTEPGTGLGATIDEAWDDSIAFLGDVVGAVLTVVVFAWWLPLLALPLYAVGSRWLRGRSVTTGAVD